MEKLDACFEPDDSCLFEIGQLMYLDYAPMGNHLKTRLVGAEKGEYLILKNPIPDILSDFQVHADNEVTIRYIFHGTAYGFQSRLIAVKAKPGNLLFIEYPRLIAEHGFRSDERVFTYIPIELEINDFKAMGYIQDLSHTGCAFVIKESHADAETDLESLFSEDKPLRFNMLITGMDGEQHLEGKVVRIDKALGKMLIGVAFDEEAQKANQVIVDYIFSIE